MLNYEDHWVYNPIDKIVNNEMEQTSREKIPLVIQPGIINSIASLYNDTNRIFMEYIDNSLDSAEEFYNAETNSYDKEIEITVQIEGDRHTNGKVIIADNCTGVRNFTKIVQSVGQSDKKEQPWTNGQFGYGIYSFLATCSILNISTKEAENPSGLRMTIQKDLFEGRIEDALFDPPEHIDEFIFDSGTVVVLSGFDKSGWKQIDIAFIKDEIETHFEQLLRRKNVGIKIISKEGVEYRCEPYDYSKINGQEMRFELSQIGYIKGRNPVTTTIPLSKPIEIYLKLCKEELLDRPPIFIIKGRRIGRVHEIFKSSKHRSDVWGNPHLTGYVDLKDLIEPTIARNDFKNTNRTRALFSSLESVEDEILGTIREIQKESDDKHYQALEDKLNKALSQLAKIDQMNFRKSILDQGVNPVGTTSGSGALEEGFGSKDRGDDNPNHSDEGFGGMNEGEGFGVNPERDGDLLSGEGDGSAPSDNPNENPYDDTHNSGSERNKSGFTIEIKDIPPPTREGIPVRSQEIDGTITIYKQHPDFESRVQQTRKGDSKVTQRLITYLAGEITVHYKDKYQTRQGQPEYNKAMFENLVDFIYQFEELLSDLENQNLANFGLGKTDE